MQLCVELKTGERQVWTDVIAIVRLEPDIVILHSGGTETVYPIGAVVSIRLA